MPAGDPEMLFGGKSLVISGVDSGRTRRAGVASSGVHGTTPSDLHPSLAPRVRYARHSGALLAMRRRAGVQGLLRRGPVRVLHHVEREAASADGPVAHRHRGRGPRQRLDVPEGLSLRSLQERARGLPARLQGAEDGLVSARIGGMIRCAIGRHVWNRSRCARCGRRR